MNYYTMKDEAGCFYPHEFLEVHKKDITDQMVIDARMDCESLSEMLASGFQIVRIEMLEVDDEVIPYDETCWECEEERPGVGEVICKKCKEKKR